MKRTTILILLLALLLAGCDSASYTTVYESSSTTTPESTATAVHTNPSALTLVFDWHAGLGQECNNCGRVNVHAPWKLAYRCPADPPGVGGYGIWFNFSSSNGTTQDSAHAAYGCTGSKQWLDSYSGMPSVGSGSWLYLDAASYPDPRPFNVNPSVYSCDIWIYQA